jgi:hypothetical protein
MFSTHSCSNHPAFVLYQIMVGKFVSYISDPDTDMSRFPLPIVKENLCFLFITQRNEFLVIHVRCCHKYLLLEKYVYGTINLEFVEYDSEICIKLICSPRFYFKYTHI